MSAMNSNSRWHTDMKVPKTGGLLGIVTAIYTIGNIVGSFVAGPAGDRWGRRAGMFISAVIVIVGAVVLCTAQNVHAFLAGRFVTGFGLAIGRSAAPSWVAEFSPPQWRGPAVLLYNSLWLVGAIVSSAIAYGTGPIASSLSWRLPLILQVVPSTVVLLGAWLLPESPRWLIANDRHEEARALLAKYHANGDSNARLIDLEMVEMRDSIQQEASDKRWYDYSELFSSRSTRYRTFLVVSMAVIGMNADSSFGACICSLA
jgi:MFS family permease